MARNLPGQAEKKKAGIGALAEKLVQTTQGDVGRKRQPTDSSSSGREGPLPPPSDRLSFLARLFDAVCSAWQSDRLTACSHLFRLEDILSSHSSSGGGETSRLNVIRAVVEQGCVPSPRSVFVCSNQVGSSPWPVDA